MDEYDKKFAEMQKYIPFLEAMIERLQKVKDKSREAQLQKMQSLHGILSNSKRKLRIETLQRCEDVLQKLHNKVEKEFQGNTTGLHTSNKKNRENSSRNNSSRGTPNTESSDKPQMEMMDNETPASPSPTASPDHMPQSTPIIIPTERRDETRMAECDSKPASPDQCEHVPVTAPIIIPTERKDDCQHDQGSTNHNSMNCGSDSNDLFSEWDLLEESENQMNKSRRTGWQSAISSGTDVATAAKLVSNNFPQKVIPESRSHIPMPTRHIPTVPAPSIGGLRRIMSVFDKSRPIGTNAGSLNSESRPESPVNVPEVRLKSPDPDILFPRLRITSPRQKDGVHVPKLSPKPSTPLLVSPPSVLTEPPLSIEDLAELLSDEGDGRKNEKQNKDSAIEEKESKPSKEVGSEDICKSKKEVLPGKHLQKNCKDSNESKVPSSFVLTQEDIDRESERRWEEIDKHIVKLTARKCLNNKHSDTKNMRSPPRISQPLVSPVLSGVDKSADHRNRPPSPLQNVIKEKENEKEHRYADNYERHPRQFRDAHDSADDTKDKSTISSSLSRTTNDQFSNVGYQNLRNNIDIGTKSDDNTRNAPLYQRRSQSNVAAETAPPLGRADDYRRDNVDFFPRKPATKPQRVPLLSSPAVPDFPNPQWGSTASYSGNIRPPLAPAPNAYQRNSNNSNFHQDMWQMGPQGCPPAEFHQMNETESRIPPFNPHPPVRPLNNSAPRQQDVNRGMNSESGFREEAPCPIPVIQPLLSPPGFPTGTQYRNQRMENRTYDSSYDRSSDISQTRHTWDSASARVSDVGYRRDNETVRGRTSTDGPTCRPGTPAPYTRPGTPAPLWTRDRERGDKDWSRRGHGRERYYNDRGRSESKTTPFNHDSRKSEWEKDGPSEKDNRARVNRVSERDPRVRPEQQQQSTSQPKETVTTATVRDPRLVKDVLNVADKPKDNVATSSDRDPRKRSCDTKGTKKTSPTRIQLKAKDKSKTQKLIDQKNRKDCELEETTNDKMLKDKLHSPLESLYGVIDTKAKTGQGYGLQKFKIPKIKRPDPPPPPPASPKTETITPEIKMPITCSSVLEQLPEGRCENVINEKDESDQNEDKIDEGIETTCYVPSMLSGTTSKYDVDHETPVKDMDHEADCNISQKPEVISSSGDSIVQEISTPTEALLKESSEQTGQGELSKEPDASKPKEEVTKEWIEALIRKSFEFGQGKQLFDQAKLLHKLGEALHAKKLKKIKKIIESDSESSSSDKEEEVVEPRKTQGKKKRRVIFSDSSEEESLANRLGLLKQTTDEQNTNKGPFKDKLGKEINCTAQNENQSENHDTQKAVPKAVDEKTVENPDENEESHGTSDVVDKTVLSIAKKKKSNKKRGKGTKKVGSNLEDPELSERAELNEDDPKAKDPSESKETEKKIIPKVKNKRRNSLEMLQEDIREMFISEGVVTATGHRMCRLIKEGNSNLNTTVQNLPDSKGGTSGKNVSKPDDKIISLVDSDTDDSDLADQSKKNDSVPITRGRSRYSKFAQARDANEQHGKIQKRTSKRISKVISKQYIDSSESEDDEPLIKSLTRSESTKSHSDSEAKTATQHNDSMPKSESPQSSETQKSEDSQAVMLLRRSKRVPRVLVEKTEVPKLDSSKMMFDSSSDESFGIDVSELAAAVDISLHPEPQSHPDPETPESPKAPRRRTRMQTTSKNKHTSQKNKYAKINEDNADDTMSFTDEGSMLSDISMSSSITSMRKNTRNSNCKNTTKGQQDTNEELLSNILIGLTAKSIPEKSNEIEKDSDVDADEELDDTVCETTEGIKKSVTKRKKKKFNWQMGILSKKKKRKKKASATTSPIIPAIDPDFTNPFKSLGESDPKDHADAGDGDIFHSINESEAISLTKKNHTLDDVISQDGAKDNTNPRENENSRNNEKYIETVDAVISSEIAALLEHAWTGQERYKCMLCTFTGKNIVHHYKQNHPEDEVLISRLVPADAKLAIEEANNIKVRRSWSVANFKYNCRFCLFSASGTKETARESFYEHCTTHTGEYRYKCVSCPYQTVAKSSVKSHYYKVCRRFSENVSTAIIEDSIPDENFIHGYICSICNFVQLKKCNIENHILSKHRKTPNAKCIRINMSLDVNERPKTTSQAVGTNKESSVDVENLSGSQRNRNIVSKNSDYLDEVIEIIEEKNSEEIQFEEVKNKAKVDTQEIGERIDERIEVSQEIKSPGNSNQAVEDQHEVRSATPEVLSVENKIKTDNSPAKTCVSLELDSEALPINGNLSVFVCPPEVAIKEHEIQLERKKKMQEIVENIGIKVNKDGTKQPLSIIDQLKVKMDTNSKIDNEQIVIEENVNNDLIESLKQSPSSPTLNLSQFDMGGNPSTDEVSKSNTDAEFSNDNAPQPDTNLNFLSDFLEVPTSEDNIDADFGNLETKMKDPLATFDDTFPNFGSDTETSDIEMMSTFPSYDSDSSNDQSEGQIPQDVNSLLKETTTDNNAPAKGLMHITIQRLAAQLKNTQTGSLNQTLEDTPVKIENSHAKIIPRAPDVVPLSSVKSLWNTQEKRSKEIKYEQFEALLPPKNLIRIRRLSGDKLSVPSNPLEPQDENQTSSTEGSASDLGAGVLQTDTEEECSFLRIENVVSLAPTAENAEDENSIISDIRKAVETSPIKPRISILKKSPIILQKVGNRSVLNQRLINSINNTGEPLKIIPLKSVPSTSQSPKQVLANIIPVQSTSKVQASTNIKKPMYVPAIIKSGTASTVGAQVQPTGNMNIPAKSNFKIIKLTRTAPVLKHKESAAQSVAMKLKSVESYKLMLQPAKLCHLFKCMARTCSYTTNSLEFFKNHYEEHVTVSIKENMKRPFGCQSCAYCCDILDDWNLMEKHLLSRHAHCRYQCSYCFYRAVTQSYVELHQSISHPGHLIAVLEGKSMGDNIPDECIDRREIIKPFICQQECGKSFYSPETFITHLKTNHGPLLSMFKCHMCPATSLKAEKLVSHYKMHGIYKYQCMYCLNGSDVPSELHNHLSNFHCNLPPYVIERTLLPGALSSQDAIDQLVLKNVDDDFKYTDLVDHVQEIPEEEWKLPGNVTLKDGQNSSEISTNKSKTETFYIDKDKSGKISLLKRNLYPQFADSSDATITATGSNAVHFVIRQAKDDEILDNRISIPEVDDFDEYSLQLSINMLTEQPAENHTQDLLGNSGESRSTFEYTKTDDAANCQTVDSSQKPTDQTGSRKTLFVINNEVDPLSIPENPNCNDPLMKNYRIQNTETLKSIVKTEQSILLPKLKNTTPDTPDNYADSDIEILEDNVHIVQKTANEEVKTSPEINTPDHILKDDAISSDKVEETGASVIENNVDDLNVNIDSNTITEASGNIVQPLTLHDIKYTGYAGSELYKCGNDDCSFSAETVELLKGHLTSCTAYSEGNSLSCAHCRKRFVKAGFLLEHLKTHGLKRFGCSLCHMRCTLPHQAMSHMKAKHKYASNKLVPADPKNPSTDGLFIVQPIRGGTEKGRGKKRTPVKVSDKESDKCIEIEKLSFNPSEIDTLPRQAIYNREVLCAVCPYTTKVRTNMVRHLQLHAKDQTVPESGPVNPVPCLDKKERMFDKMVNLASSSHQNGRMGGKTREIAKKDTDDAFLPKFVPEHKRYVCGVAECNYLTVDDTMLRCHLKALHSDEPYFRCPHCPIPQPGQEVQNIGIDKMGIHLKMHDNRLYKCSHCNHHHYHRHVVERHLSDKHAEKRPFVKVIREPETTETAQANVQDEVEDEGSDRDGNHWKCNVCDYKCMYKSEMISHASAEHDQRSQFKCTVCPYKTSGKINFEQHFISRHPTEPLIKYDMVYQKLKGSLKRPGESIDQGTVDEPFDTTPLWRRDMPRVRHIRGILLEEEGAAAASGSPTKGAKRKSDGGDISNRPAKSRPGKSTSSEISKLNDERSKPVTPRTIDAKKGIEANSLANERVSKTRAGDKFKSTDKSENYKLSESLDNPVTDTSYLEDFSELSDSDMGQFGPYGKPNGIMYVCTLCNFFETRYKHDLRDHLYRELKYKKWHCRACGFLAVNRHTLVKHFGKQHRGEQPDHEMLTPDNSIEEWVTTLLQRQTNMIKGLTNKSNPKINADKTTSPGTANAPAQSKKSPKEVNPVLQSALKSVKDSSKTVDLTHAISNMKNSSIGMDMNLDIDDEDSKDNDELVIDLKDDNLDDINIQHEKTISNKPRDKKDMEKLLTCKHCNMKFARWRGFKLHVQVTHLKRLSYLCPYCDRSANSEVTIRQHVRAKHPGLLEKILHNPAAGGPELTKDFWEREYGLICPNKRKSRKRKRKSKNEADEVKKPKVDTEKIGSREVCDLCGFTAVTVSGLKAHMRIHANKHTMKCAYCTFSGSVDADIRQHWRVNHPHLPFKFDDLTMASPSSESPSLHQQKKEGIEEYSDDIEEEQVPSETSTVKKVSYGCFYCSLRSSSLDTVKAHWQRVHKESKNLNEIGKWTTGLPFRYRQVHASVTAPPKLFKCGYCEKKASKPTLRVHMKRKHSQLPPLFVEVPEVAREAWVCQWCNEFCESEAKMKHHHNMFHSHLPSHFKKQGPEEQQKRYNCPECPFTSMSTVLIKKHVTKHVNLFKCKYCDTTFTTPSLVASHSTRAHPGSELKIESISNYNSLIEKLMTKALLSNSQKSIKSETSTEQAQTVSPSKRNAVAKKSTAKLPLRVLPMPNKMRCVARKSTNSLSRYPPGLSFHVDRQWPGTSYSSRDMSPSRNVVGYSYYGVPNAPINLASLSTYMSVGGHQMKVNCTNLGQLMNINPKVLVKDIKQDIRGLSVLSNST